MATPAGRSRNLWARLGVTRRAGSEERSGGGRLAVVVLLAVLVAVGLHTQVGGPAWRTSSRALLAEVAGAADAVAAFLLIALLVRSHRTPTDQPLLVRLRTALRYVLGAAVAALSLVVLLLLVKIPLPKPKAGKGPRGLSAPRQNHLGHFHASRPASSGFPVAELFFGLLAALLLLAVLAVLWRFRQGVHSRQEPEPGEPPEEFETALEGAVAGGRHALLQLDDARAAIIACYVAMEDSLARAGSARLSTETPDELLAKAAGSLREGAGAARRLTTLFYEARFSTHPMDAARRDDAEQALATLALELGGTASMVNSARP